MKIPQSPVQKLSSEVGKIAVTNDFSETAWKVDSAGKLAKNSPVYVNREHFSVYIRWFHT